MFQCEVISSQLKKGVEKPFKSYNLNIINVTKITYGLIVFNNENSNLTIKSFFLLFYYINQTKKLAPAIPHIH